MCDTQDERLDDPTPQAQLAPSLPALLYSPQAAIRLRGRDGTVPEEPACAVLQRRTQGRLTRPSAKRSEIRRTRGAFHR
jgi:hypothetical protein